MQVAVKDRSFFALFGEFRLLNGERSEVVFVGTRLADSCPVVAKVEKNSKKLSTARKNRGIVSSLEHEHAVYKFLHGRGVPLVQWFGAVGEFQALVMDLTGPALEELFVYCKRRFSLKTVLLLADQMLDRIQCLHDAGYIHGDITPDNFVMGIGRNSCKVYLLNMKWASEYINRRSHKHVLYSENVKFYGSPHFASLNRHLGTLASRRDDLESCIYILIYFLRGSLPWQLYEGSPEDMEAILEMKTSISVEDLCHGLPEQFAMILNYCQTLKFEDQPNYLFLRRLLRNLFVSLAFKEDNTFDWMSRYRIQQQFSATT